MKVKDYIVQTLQLIENERPVARPLIKLIQEDVLDQEALGVVKEILVGALKSVAGKHKAARLQRTIDMIEKIQQKEEESVLNDKSELDALEAEINSLED